MTIVPRQRTRQEALFRRLIELVAILAMARLAADVEGAWRWVAVTVVVAVAIGWLLLVAQTVRRPPGGDA